MSKDTSLLNNVSEYFTEKTLENIAAKLYHENIENIEILSWDFGNASKKGDSYLSTVDRVVIKSKIKNEMKEIKLVVKSLPNNIGRRKTYRSADFFRNEIIFYTEIATKFQEFLKLKQQQSLLLIPNCVAFHLDGNHDFIALEDVCPKGFGPVTRQNCLNFEQCAHILKAMARFHGISFAYKDQNKQDFDNVASKLFETYFTNDLYENWYKNFHTALINIAKDALSKEYPNSEGECKFNSYEPGELYKKSVEFCSRNRAATSVINQGDSWAPNFLMRLNSSKEIEILMLDFQLARCSSPVLDIAFFMYSCTDKTLRDAYFDELLKIYHDNVSETIKILGSDPQKIYSWKTFLDEVNEQFVHGVVFGLESITFSMLSEEESFDLDIIKNDKVDIADVWTVQNIKTSENRCRLADMILHAASRGYL